MLGFYYILHQKSKKTFSDRRVFVCTISLLLPSSSYVLRPPSPLLYSVSRLYRKTHKTTCTIFVPSLSLFSLCLLYSHCILSSPHHHPSPFLLLFNSQSVSIK